MMAREHDHSFLNDQRGATAATFGLALFALVAIGGTGFDYARLAGMDSELQNAADQAALAGASQLDGKNGTCLRASAAATTLVANLTLLANDGDGRAVTIAAEPDCDAVGNIRFWQNKEKTLAATDDGNANFIEIFIDFRTANYAFTPLVAAFSGNASAAALAGLGSAICKVPPVMMCNPNEAGDINFTIGNYVGKGIKLIADGSYVPGNFGFLSNGAGNGAAELRRVLGQAVPPGDCVAIDGVETEPGAMTSVRDALNTRFDVFDNGLNNTCGNDNSLCPSASNTRKDVVMADKANKCDFSNKGWKEGDRPYRPTSATTKLTAAEGAALSPMGYPRDMCHAVSIDGTCSGGRIGDGNWDFMAYFRSNSENYPTVPSSGDLINWFGTETPRRYDVYKYEMANASTRLKPDSDGGDIAYGQRVCAGSSLAPSATVADRRVLPVAVVNCAAEGVSGRKTGVHVTKWVDVFLTEPSLDRVRTSNKDVYVEVIGETVLGGGGGTTGNTVRRDVPYLIQ